MLVRRSAAPVSTARRQTGGVTTALKTCAAAGTRPAHPRRRMPAASSPATPPARSTVGMPAGPPMRAGQRQQATRCHTPRQPMAGRRHKQVMPVGCLHTSGAGEPRFSQHLQPPPLPASCHACTCSAPGPGAGAPATTGQPPRRCCGLPSAAASPVVGTNCGRSPGEARRTWVNRPREHNHGRTHLDPGMCQQLAHNGNASLLHALQARRVGMRHEAHSTRAGASERCVR